MDAAAGPRLIPGGLHVDARGVVSFSNAFDFKGVDRFYWIRFPRPEVPRAWVGHRREQKWFVVVQGDVLVALVRPDDWQAPRPGLPVSRHVLSAAAPQVLHVPAGHAIGMAAKTCDAVMMVFSSGLIGDAGEDDFRFPADRWPVGCRGGPDAAR